MCDPIVAWHADWACLLLLQKAGIPIVPTKLVLSTQELVRTAVEWRDYDLTVRSAHGPIWTPIAQGRATVPGFIECLQALPSGVTFVVQVDISSLAASTQWSVTLELGRVTATCRMDADGCRPEPVPREARAALEKMLATASLHTGSIENARLQGAMIDGELVLESLSWLISPLPMSSTARGSRCKLR